MLLLIVYSLCWAVVAQSGIQIIMGLVHIFWAHDKTPALDLILYLIFLLIGLGLAWAFHAKLFGREKAKE